MSERLSVEEALGILGGKASGHAKAREYLAALTNGGFSFSQAGKERLHVHFNRQPVGTIHFDDECTLCHEAHVHLSLPAKS